MTDKVIYKTLSVSEAVGLTPTLSIEFEAEGVSPVDIDPNQLEMALLNLAVNARDAMASGGVLTIRLTMQNADDDAQLGIQSGRYVVLSVQDTGVGMDAETLAKAAEPFFSTKGVGRVRRRENLLALVSITARPWATVRP
ncbi:ATP-binding protein [Bradyrhizobium erythrophlei]|uniref:ATP-binding protein n=1 Tax=Bradyrhizobium erythrophlei TaxID=1437360 RepID=UPI001FCDA266|nr:ATP-binding protein [Bradyrhizobium erythrophlei]